MRVIPFVQPFLVLLMRLRHGGQFQRRQRREAADVIRGDLVGGDANVDPVAMIRVRQFRRQPRGKLQRMRRTVEGRDRHARNALHHQALLQHGLQRLDVRRRRRQKTLRRLGPELVHDDAMRHVHESQAHRRLGALGLIGPAHAFQKRQSERHAHAFQQRAAINQRVAWHGLRSLSVRTAVWIGSSSLYTSTLKECADCHGNRLSFVKFAVMYSL